MIDTYLFDSHLLSLILLTPLVGVAVLLAIGRSREDAIRRLATLFAGLDFLISVPLWFRYDPQASPWQFTERATWIPSMGASYFLGVDGYSSLMVLMTTLLGFIAVLSSWTAVTDRVKEYYICLLGLQSGMLGAFLALDGLLFFLFWEAMLVPMYLLIGIRGGGRRSSSAIKFFLYTLVGSVGLLLGILGIYFCAHEATGVYSFDITGFHQLTLPLARQKWIFLALLVGFAIQIPMFPLHMWLPDAHADAPTAGSVILAAVLLKMGTYGFVRFSLPILPEASRAFIPVVAGLSIVAIVYGALLALAQTDWKRLIAYSSISQMGMITLGLFAIAPAALSGSLLQQINHGISTGALFLIVGLVFERRQTREIAAFGGLSSVMPVFAVLFLVMTLSSIGLPGLNGFVGERLILQGVFVTHRWWAAAAASGMVLGAAYMLWLYQRTMFGGIREPANAALRDLTARELLTLVPLAALALWIGLYPAPLLARLEPTMARVITRLDPGYAPAFAKVPGCGAPGSTGSAPSAPPGFTAMAPCDDPSRPAGTGR
jgi:NADH-quinone oxidoreductase subunit M